MWNFLTWLEDTGIATWVREGDFIVRPFSTFYIMLAFHSIGMSAVVGVTWVLATRIFGYIHELPLAKAVKLMPIAWWGFYINLVSGIFLFIAQPRRELLTPVFDIKILLIVLAVITMRMMEKALGDVEIVANPDGTASEVASQTARVAALCTGLFWLAAIIAGRIIGYVQPPPPG